MSGRNMKAIREEFKSRGIFETPPELALFLRDLIPGTPQRVYDPTCGSGALLAQFPDEVQKYGQDIDGAAVEYATDNLVNFRGAVGDIFTEPAWLDERFDAIVANPPFSVKWEPQADERFMYAPTVPTAGKADYAFLLHILHMLTDDGVAAVLNFPGILYRGNREGMIRRWMVEQNYIDQVISVPGNKFTDTAIATACLVLRKNRTESTIRFVNREHGIERDVPVAEVAANDFVLSVNHYAQPEPEPVEPVDMTALERTARATSIGLLVSSLKLSRLMQETTGLPVAEFVADARSAIDDFENEVIAA